MREGRHSILRLQQFIQLRAFARQDGLIIGLLWASSFMVMLFLPTSSLFAFIALSTPFVVGWRLVKFRNYALKGVISFRRALVYCWYVFFYSSVIFAFVQIAYFLWFDSGRFISLLQRSYDIAAPTYKQYGLDTSQLSDAITMIRSFGAVELGFIFMMQNLCIGFFLAFPIALFGKKRQS